MEIIFEEPDFQTTPLDDISLRKRTGLGLNGKLFYTVKLNDEFLMSGLFAESEIQLSKSDLAAFKKLNHKKDLNIVVGGLGLGYTADAVLEDQAIKSLKASDVMDPVINWHKRGFVPLEEKLTPDPRCTLIHADFFAVATSDSESFDDDQKQVHAVLLDIDHSPTHWLNKGNSSFYTEVSLNKLANKIVPCDHFWSLVK